MELQWGCRLRRHAFGMFRVILPIFTASFIYANLTVTANVDDVLNMARWPCARRPAGGRLDDLDGCWPRTMHRSGVHHYNIICMIQIQLKTTFFFNEYK